MAKEKYPTPNTGSAGGPTNVDSVLSECSYPSAVDNGAVRNDTPSEGSESSLPQDNPIMGADGTLPFTDYDNTGE